jgi:uncharacterized protein involved in exopolysaccharide biosynthesis
MRARTPDPHGDIDISALPSVLKRSSGKLALAALAVGALTYGALLLVPSRYTSEAQIRIGAPPPSEGGRGAVGTEAVALSIDKEAIASRVQELRSPDLARTLAAELSLASRPEFNDALEAGGLGSRLLRRLGLAGPRPGETEEERILAAYYKALQVYQVKDTRVISLGFTARDGELAALAANRLAELYQSWLRQRGATETTDANAWLLPEIEKRTRELAEAEGAAERFRSTANLFRSGNQPSGLAEQQLTELASELTKVRAQRSEAEARARAARELIGSGVPDAIPEVQRSPVIQGLIAQRVRVERDLAEAATQLLPAHPRMKQLTANVTDVRRQIQREAQAVVGGLEREVKALALREELQRRTLDEAKAGLGDKAADRVRLAQLEDDAMAKRRELDELRRRHEASRSRGTSLALPVDVQVIATARPSSRPSWPNRIQIALLAAAATFVLGLVAVLFRELLAAGSRAVLRSAPRPEDAPPAAMPAQPVADPATASRPAAPLPRPVPVAAATAPIAAGGPGSETDQSPSCLGSIVAVADRLLRSAGGRNGYRTLVVGAGDVPDERGRAAELATALATSGRQVVLVDWSLDGEGIAGRLGAASSPGFTDLLHGAAAFEEVIRATPDGAFHIVPCGSACAGGIEALDPNRMNLLLDALDEAYADVVITGTHAAARDFFWAIEGRVDAGVVIHPPGTAPGTAPDLGGDSAARRLLGFDVTDIDVVHLCEQTARPTIGRPGRRPVRGVAPAQAATTA